MKRKLLCKVLCGGLCACLMLLPAAPAFAQAGQTFTDTILDFD